MIGLPILRQALPVLDTEEEKRLIAQLPHTRDALTRHNLPLITALASKHSVSVGRNGDLDLMSDLVQEGVEGFLHALDKFEPERGYKLSTYAIWWIEQRMRRYLEAHTRVVRLPAHLNEKVRRVQQGKSSSEQESKNPKMQWVIDQLVNQTGDREVSLDSLLNTRNRETCNGTWYDTIPAPDTEIDERLDREQILARLRDGLPAREFEILQRRAEDETLTQIGATLGVTRERVRQIEMSARTKAKALLQHLDPVF